MKYEHLLYFKKLAEYRSFSKAAEVLYVSQSALSKSIVALEEELGGRLFERNNKTVRLSAFGEFMESHIDNLIEAYEAVNRAAGEFKLVNQQSLTVATCQNLPAKGLSSRMIAFEEARKNFYIEINEEEHLKLLSIMRNNGADAYIGYREIIGHVSGYDIYDLYEDPLVFITSAEHAARKGWSGEISPAELPGEWLSIVRTDTLIYSFISRIFRNYGYKPQDALSRIYPFTIREYVRRGMRSTVLMKSSAGSLFKGREFAILPLQCAEKLTMSLFVPSGKRTKVLEEFITCMTGLASPDDKIVRE